MIVETQEAFDEALETLIQYPSWTVDIESNGLEGFGKHQLCGIGIAVNSPIIDTWYFPFRHHLGVNLHPTNLASLIQAMSNLNEILGYNLKFDLRFLEKDGLKVDEIPMLIDVMLPVRMTAASEIRDLRLVKTVERFFGKEAASYDKDTKKMLQSKKWSKDFSMAPASVLGPYCELDAFYTQKIFNVAYETIIETEQLDVLLAEIELTKVLYNMERTGISIDTSYAEQCIDRIETRKTDLEARIFDIAGTDFNIKSNAEVGDAFHNLGIYSTIKTEKQNESWSAAALAQINHPLAGLIREYRGLVKLQSTYLEPYAQQDILHTSFCNWGTVTGRLSSRSPNLQNIPRDVFNLSAADVTETELDSIKGKLDNLATDASSWLDDEVVSTWNFLGTEYYDPNNPNHLAIRRLFVPREGCKLLSIDFSQMEIRVFLSYLNNDEVRALLNRQDVDFHGETAKVAFGVDEEHPEWKYYRQLAKGISFGLIYGIGNERLGESLNTTKQAAKQYKESYLDQMTGSREFIKGVQKAVETRGYVKNKYGRMYQLPKRDSYKGVNYLVQGTSADLLNERLLVLHDFLADKASSMLLQVHDEVVFEIANHEEDWIIPKLVDILQTNTLDIPLYVDIEICDESWASKRDYVIIKDPQIEEKREKEINKMAKISAHYGVTMQLDWGYEKLELTISDIDADVDLEPQLMNCEGVTREVIDFVSNQVHLKVDQLLGKTTTEQESKKTEKPATENPVPLVEEIEKFEQELTESELEPVTAVQDEFEF